MYMYLHAVVNRQQMVTTVSLLVSFSHLHVYAAKDSPRPGEEGGEEVGREAAGSTKGAER